MKHIQLIFILSCFFLVKKEAVAQQNNSWTLDACINYALEQNIDVRKSKLSNSSQIYQLEQARSQRFPSVNANVNENFNWSKNSMGDSNLEGTNSTSFSVSSSVTVYNFSKITNQIKQSELDVENGKYQIETVKESITLSVLNAFLQVLYAEEQVKNSMKQIESTTEQLNLAKERYDLHAISQADYLQVKSQLASEKLTLASAQSQLATAKVSLMQLMELPVTNDFEVTHPNLDDQLNQQLTPAAQVVYEQSLQIKPQIKQAELDKEIAMLDKKIARAGFFPVLSASAGLSSSYLNQSTGSFMNQLDNSIAPSAGLTLSVPIYQKKQIKTSVALAEISYNNAELSEIDTKNQLRKNIEQACQDVYSAQIEYEANVENFDATEESSALSDEKFKQGVINSVDYLVSKTNLIVAESQLLQSKYNLIFSYKILDFYLGNPLSL